MQSLTKIVAKKSKLKKLDQCKEIADAIKNDTAGQITEIDLSHNMITDLSLLEVFSNLQ